MRYVICIWLLFAGIVAVGQSKKIDSLQNVFKASAKDTTGVNILNKIAKEYYTQFIFDSAGIYLNKALLLAVSLNFIKGQSISLNMLGAINFYKGDYDKAKDFYARSLSIKEEIGDKNGAATLYCNIAGIHLNTGNYTEALKYSIKSLKINIEINNKKGAAASYNIIGETYRFMGNYPEATKQYFLGLKNAEEVNDKARVGGLYNNLGIIFQGQNKFEEALRYYYKGLAINKAEENIRGAAGLYHNIATIYNKTKNYPEALKNFLLALKLNSEVGNKNWMGNNYTGIASVYVADGNTAGAFDNLQKALKIRLEIGDKGGVADAYSSLASLNRGLKNYKGARQDINKSLIVAQEIKSIPILAVVYKEFTSLDSSENRYKEAFEHHKLYILCRDSMVNEDNTKKILQTQMQYDFDKKENVLKLEQAEKNLQAKEENEKKNIIIWSICGILLMVIVFAIFAYRNYLQKQKANIEITHQKNIIEEKQKEILDSINYAKRLQEAILPPLQFVKQYLPETFILYSPKDIVAGDFYWMETIFTPGAGKGEELTFIAAADCTGHGVPGAMVSVICSTALSRAVKEFGLTAPGKILDKTRELVLETFSRSDKDVKDGMDISLISISQSPNSETIILQWSGANNPLWYVKGKEMHIIIANKQSIGKTDNPLPFTTHSLELNKGDSIYLFTDGFADQFGGPKGKKFKYKALQELIMRNTELSIAQQKEHLDLALQKWKGNLEQVDDVCIIGIKF